MRSLLTILTLMISADTFALGSPSPGVIGGMGNSVSTLNQVHQGEEDKKETPGLKRRQEQEEMRGEPLMDPRLPLTREEKEFNKNEPY